MPDVSVLDIELYGQTIGHLTRVPGDRTLLSFTDDYIENQTRPTLSLSFKDRFGALITDHRPVQTKLHPFFSNLLPEGHLREHLSERAGVNTEREFFLLWVLGQDLPGAITVRAADGDSLPPLSENVRLSRHRAAAQDLLRFSLAGVQLKFSAVTDSQDNKGLTIPAHGVGGDWIVKLPSGRFEGVPENEYAMMTIARLIGIEVPDVQLIDPAGISGLPERMSAFKGKAFAVSRFDRTADGPLHIEDFAQVFGVFPEDKYKKASYRNIAQVLGIETDELVIAEFVRRLVFSVLTGNADMHLKNWSLIYYDRRTPTLSPAYDLVSTIPYLDDEYAALKFSRTKRLAGFTLDELSHLAAKAGLPQKPVLDIARETVALFHEVWAVEKHNLPQAKAVTVSIDAHLADMPIAKI